MTPLLVSLLFSVVGALVYALASNGKVVEIGRALLWVGLFFLAMALSGLHFVA